MAKNDKEFGEWIGTCLVPRKASIKRFEHGFIIKNLKTKEEIRESHPETTSEDMTHKIAQNYFYE